MIKAHVVLIFKRVALSRHDHVVVFSEHDSSGTLKLLRSESCVSRERRGLALFSAKSTAHAFDHANDVLRGQTQSMSHHMLSLGGVL